MAPADTQYLKNSLCKIKGLSSSACSSSWLSGLGTGSLVHSPLHSQQASEEGSSYGYGAYTAFAITALLAVYLVAVVLLVRRQIYQVEEEGMERIIMTDKRGKTGIRKVEEVLRDKKEVLI
eukprot:TRINITY_DN31300_c0_g1_i3.p1 TRINITY_DN31300_c0_g1~~TRINITY_DN31300_c0_g1_i3.p1  ORF type:complete len:121 (-),score=40.62 TRINITY_DN31300_c0_g1_i3:20-382(-)